MTAKGLEIVRVTCALVLLLPCFPSRGQFVTAVPNSLFLIEGDTNSIYPFWVTWPYTGRYQQVYAASQFSLPSNGGQYYQKYFAAMTNGGWISDLFFRFDGGTAAVRATVPNVEVHLSTTQRQPGGLSSVFSDNVGPDDTIVFSGSFILVNSSFGSSPEAYESHIALKTNFWYNPAAGNLLLDVRVYQGVNYLPAGLDAVSQTGESVSSVYSTNETSGAVDTRGLVTFFQMAPPPLLVAYISNAPPANYIVLNWINQPVGFVLQESTSLGSNASWSNLLGADTNVDFKQFVYSATGSAQFFRLARP